MANPKHLDILKQGVEVWNEWRDKYSNSKPDLSEAFLWKANLNGINLSEANLIGANLSEANLIGADLRCTDLSVANLSKANLDQADLSRANLYNTNFSDAKLIRADLVRADLGHANLSGADIRHADLSKATFVDTSFANANLTGCRIFGVSVWGVSLEGTIQKDLVITQSNEPIITVDSLEVAQFIYLLLNNQKIRNVINTITSKVVLILGRFTNERKPVLDAIRDELRNYNYSPVVFDFEKPGSRNFTETISTLAHLSRFIIADLTDAKSIPQELERIIPRLRVPVQSLLHISEKDTYAMYKDFEDYHWVLPIYRYSDQNSLLCSLQEYIINPAEQKALELEKRK